MKTADDVHEELDRLRQTLELLPADPSYDGLRMVCEAQLTALAWVLDEFGQSPSQMADDAIRLATEATDEADDISHV